MSGTRSTELTDQDRGLLRLVAAGLTNAAIAREVPCHLDTLKSRLGVVMGKLGVRTRTEAVTRWLLFESTPLDRQWLLARLHRPASSGVDGE
ncbi:MAG: helix-turn-helix domain-containing protein [Sciscionella sp.]